MISAPYPPSLPASSSCLDPSAFAPRSTARRHSVTLTYPFPLRPPFAIPVFCLLSSVFRFLLPLCLCLLAWLVSWFLTAAADYQTPAELHADFSSSYSHAVLITARISWSSRRVRKYRVGAANATSQWDVIETLIQSAAIYSAALITLLTVYLAGSNAQFIVLDLMQPLIVRLSLLPPRLAHAC